MRHGDMDEMMKKGSNLYKHFASTSTPMFGSEERTHFQININSTSPETMFVNGTYKSLWYDVNWVGEQGDRESERYPQFSRHPAVSDFVRKVPLSLQANMMMKLKLFPCLLPCVWCHKQIYTFFLHNHRVCLDENVENFSVISVWLGLARLNSTRLVNVGKNSNFKMCHDNLDRANCLIFNSCRMCS